MTTTPEQLAEDTLTVIDDALADGRPDVAARLLLEAFEDPRLVDTLLPARPIERLLVLWRDSPPEARRAQAGYERWLAQHELGEDLQGWPRAVLGLERTLARLPDEFPAEPLAIVTDAILRARLIELKPRLRRWAWANPEAAALASAMLPEPDPLAELLGRGGDPLRDLIGETLGVRDRGTRPLPPAQAIARARALIEGVEGDHFRAEAWRDLHDLLFEQSLETSAAVVDAIEPLLDDWPDALRVTLGGSPWDFDIVTGVEEPAHRLIRSLEYGWMFFSRAGKVMIRNPRLDAQDGLRLARSPSARWLTRINLNGQQLGPEVASAWAQSGLFERLERLDLGGCGLTTRGLVALANGYFPSLTHAKLSRNEGGAEAAQAWANFGALQLLDLSQNPIAEGVAGFANAQIEQLWLADCQLRADQLPEFGVTTLLLDRNELGPEAGALLRAPSLRELSLTKTELGDEGLAALALPELERIDVGDNGITAAGLAHTRVVAREWKVDDNPITDSGFATILAKPGCRRVTARNCGLSSACFEGAALDGIEALDLLGNPIEDVRALARAGALRDLTIGGVSLGDFGDRDWPPLDSLAVFGPIRDGCLPGVIPKQRLWLNESDLDDRLLFMLIERGDWRPEAIAIAAISGSGDEVEAFGRLGDAVLVALADSPILERVTRLRLPGHRGITSEGVIALARSRYLNRLERLDLDYCSIDDSGIVEFSRLRPRVMLEVEGNPYGDEAEAALASVPQRC